MKRVLESDEFWWGFLYGLAVTLVSAVLVQVIYG